MTTPHTVNHRVEPSNPTPEGCGLGGSPCSAISHGHFQSYLKIMPHGYSFPVELPVITKGSRDLANAWTWNGSTEKPTLKPSIRTIHADGKMSHVWLTDGVCQHLEDSTDGLAGQTLPLLPLPNTKLSDRRWKGNMNEASKSELPENVVSAEARAGSAEARLLDDDYDFDGPNCGLCGDDGWIMLSDAGPSEWGEDCFCEIDRPIPCPECNRRKSSNDQAHRSLPEDNAR